MPPLTLNDFDRAAGTRGYGSMYAKLDAHGHARDLKTLNTSRLAHALPALFGATASAAENRAARNALVKAICDSGYVDGKSAFVEAIRRQLGVNTASREGDLPLGRRVVKTIIEHVREEAAKSLSLLIDHGFSASDVAAMKKWISADGQKRYVDLFNAAKGDSEATAALVVAMRFTLERCRHEETGVSALFGALAYDPEGGAADAAQREGRAAAETLKDWIAEQFPACAGADGSDCRAILDATVERHLSAGRRALFLCRDASEEAAKLEEFSRGCLEEAQALAAKMRTARAEIAEIAGSETAKFAADALAEGKVPNGFTEANAYLRFTNGRIARELSSASGIGGDAGETALKRLREDFKVGVTSLLSADDAPVETSDAARIAARTTAYLARKFAAVESKLDAYGIPVDHGRVRDALIADGVRLVADSRAPGDDGDAFNLGDVLAWCGSCFDDAFGEKCAALAKLKENRLPGSCSEFTAMLKDVETDAAFASEKSRAAADDVFTNRFERNLAALAGEPERLTDEGVRAMIDRTVLETREIVYASRQAETDAYFRLSTLPKVLAFVADPAPDKRAEIKEEDVVTVDMKHALDEYVQELAELRRTDILRHPDAAERQPSDADLDRLMEAKMGELIAGHRANVRGRVTAKFLEAKRDYDAKIAGVERELEDFRKTLALDPALIGFVPRGDLNADGTLGEIGAISSLEITRKTYYYDHPPADFTEEAVEAAAFDPDAFAADVRDAMTARWAAGAKLYGETLRDLEAFFRESELPEAFTLRADGPGGESGACGPLGQAVTKALEDVRAFAFAGKPDEAKAAVAGIRKAVTEAILAHNAALYSDDAVGRSLNQLTAMEAVVHLIRGDAGDFNEDERAMVQVFNKAYVAGYQELAREMGADARRWHREGEALAKMEARLKDVLGMYGRCRDYVVDRVLERADLDLVLDRTVTNAQGAFKTDFAKVFTPDVNKRFKLLVHNCQEVLIANPTAFDSDGKFRQFADPFVDEIVKEALGEKSRQNLQNLVNRFNDVKGDVLSAGFGHFNALLNTLDRTIPVDEFYARISRWAERKIAELKRPLPNGSGDMRLHAATYRTFSARELTKELVGMIDARLKAFNRVADELRAAVRQRLRERGIDRDVAQNREGIRDRVNAAADRAIRNVFAGFSDLEAGDFAVKEADVRALLEKVDDITRPTLESGVALARASIRDGIEKSGADFDKALEAIVADEKGGDIPEEMLRTAFKEARAADLRRFLDAAKAGDVFAAGGFFNVLSGATGWARYCKPTVDAFKGRIAAARDFGARVRAEIDRQLAAKGIAKGSPLYAAHVSEAPARVSAATLTAFVNPESFATPDQRQAAAIERVGAAFSPIL